MNRLCILPGAKAAEIQPRAEAGEQMIIVRQVDGQDLDGHAGPLAMHPLADLRPGPGHVRQLCALVVVRR
jgi:hypothetical protein